jgi:hypothetical protein
MQLGGKCKHETEHWYPSALILRFSKKERKKEEIVTVNTACFFHNKGRSSTRDFFRGV